MKFNQSVTTGSKNISTKGAIFKKMYSVFCELLMLFMGISQKQELWEKHWFFFF